MRVTAVFVVAGIAASSAFQSTHLPRGSTATSVNLLMDKASSMGKSYAPHFHERKPHSWALKDAASVDVAGESNEDDSNTNKKGFLGRLKSVIPPANERKKVIPLALMFFCTLFNYTILRDTKDVLMVCCLFPWIHMKLDSDSIVELYLLTNHISINRR